MSPTAVHALPMPAANAKRTKIGGPGGQAARAKALAPGKALEKQRAERRRHLKTVLAVGPKPEAPTPFFLPHNKDYYYIPLDHTISLNSPVANAAVPLGQADVDAGHEARQKRELFYVNAGAPRKGRPNAGKAFHGTYPVTGKDADSGLALRADAPDPWDFELSPAERNGLRWTDPKVEINDPTTGERTVVGDPEKMPVAANNDFAIGKAPKYSKADYLARCMGYKALNTPATEAFKHHVLGVEFDHKTGKSLQVVLPDGDGPKDEADSRGWSRQRDRMRAAMRKIVMVYPYPVEPVFSPGGGVYAAGEIAAAKREKRNPETYQVPHTGEDGTVIGDVRGTDLQYLYEPQPVLFCSLTADRTSADALVPKGKDEVNNIGGAHDTTRGNPLLPSQVTAVKALLHAYNLEEEFPALAYLDESRSGQMLNLEYHRQLKLAELGPAPGEDHEELDEAWLTGLSELAFGKVWVQKCTVACPNGMVEFGTDDPMLVPLLKGRAEDKNGTPWLDARLLERDTTCEGARKYIAVTAALHRILGKDWDKSGVKRKAALGFTVMSAQRDEMTKTFPLALTDETDTKRQKKPKPARSKEMDAVLALQYREGGNAKADGPVSTAVEGLTTKCEELQEQLALATAAADKNRFVVAASARNARGVCGSVTFPEDAETSTIRVRRPASGSLYVTIGKRSDEETYQKIEVPPGVALSFNYVPEAPAEEDSDNDL